MILAEAEVANAVCLSIAERKGIRPEDVRVELVYDEDTGFSAEIFAGGREQIWIEANLIEAISRYMHKQYRIQTFRDDIVLRLEDEIVADVRT